MPETRWDKDRSPEAIAFLKELSDVCKKHGKSLGHEDYHGAFVVEPLDNESDCDWLLAAHECIYEK